APKGQYAKREQAEAGGDHPAPGPREEERNEKHKCAAEQDGTLLSRGFDEGCDLQSPMPLCCHHVAPVQPYDEAANRDQTKPGIGRKRVMINEGRCDMTA